MPLSRLDHVNLRTANLPAMIRWYDDILGLKAGARPDFAVGGAWLYCGRHPIVHLVEVEADPVNEDARIEHFAIAATGFPSFIDHLKRHGIKYQTAMVPGVDIVQVNIFDCDGNHIHIDFSAADAGDNIDQ